MAAFCCSIDFDFEFHIKQGKTVILGKCSEYTPILSSAFICTSETCFIFSSCHCDLCWMKQRGWCWSFICFNILPRASNSFILNMWQFYSLDVLMPFLYSESQIKLYPNSPCVLSFHPWYYLASLHQRLETGHMFDHAECRGNNYNNDSRYLFVWEDMFPNFQDFFWTIPIFVWLSEILYIQLRHVSGSIIIDYIFSG